MAFWNLFNLFVEPSPPVIKDLGSVAKLNREREKAREFEKHAPMFNEMLNDIQLNLTIGKNTYSYPYTEERLLCVNANRKSFRAWGRRHNLEIDIQIFNIAKPPTINVILKEIR